MIVPMTRIEVLGSKRLLQQTLDVLQDAGVVHITEAPLQDAQGKVVLERAGREAEQQAPGGSDTAALERLHERLAEMSKATPREALASEEDRSAAARVRDEMTSADLESLREHTDTIYETYREHVRRVDTLQGELQVAERYAPAFSALADLIGAHPVTGPSTDRDAEPVARRAVVLNAGASEVLAGIADMVDILTDGEGQTYRATVEGGRQAVLLVYPERYDERIGRLLGDEGIEELSAPVAYRDMDLVDAASAFQVRLEELPDEIRQAQHDRDAFLTQNAPQVKGLLAQVKGRLEASRQTDNLAVSDRVFLLEGYVPQGDFDELRVRVARELDGSAVVSDLGIAHGEKAQVPTKLRNRGLFKDFEVLLSLLPPARYGSIDATPFIAIGFPLFFGFMLGDIMYAFFVLGLGWLLRSTLGRRMDMVKAASTVLLACGFSTLGWGLLFGEFGGDVDLGLGHVIGYSRHHDLGTALVVTLFIGFIHVQLGLLLNAVKHFKHDHIRHGLAMIGAMLAIFGILLAALRMQGVVGAGIMTPTYVLLVVGAALVLWGEHFDPMGLLHILSYTGNIFSYARLMAIGLASVMLAVVANQFLRTAPLVIGLFGALFFHTLNFALGVFGPSIHSLRLHYVEFFGKFYEPQGTAYQPFRKIGGEEV